MEVVELVIVVVVCVGAFFLLDRRVQRGRVKFVKRS